MTSISSVVSDGAERLVHTVWGPFSKTGSWPQRSTARIELREVTASGRKSFDALCSELGSDVILCNDSSVQPPIIRLHLRALVGLKSRLRVPLSGGARDAENVTRAIQDCATRFIESGTSQVSGSEFIKRLGLSPLEARRVSQLLKDTNGTVVNGFSTESPDGFPVFNGLHENVVDYQHLKNLEEYFSCEDARSGRQPERSDPAQVSIRPVEGQTSESTELRIPSTDAKGVLEAAVKTVPAARYALGIAGIAAVVAIVAGFGLGWLAAGLGSLVVLILMAALLVFASVAADRRASPQLQQAGMAMAWASVGLTVIVAVLMILVTFVGWPKTWHQIVLAVTGDKSVSRGSIFRPAGPCTSTIPGLVSWWSGDGNASDAVGGRNGTLFNVAYGPGRKANTRAFSFNGVNSYVKISGYNALMPSSPFSVVAWFRANPNQSSGDRIFDLIDEYHVNQRPSGWTIEGGASGGPTGVWFAVGAPPTWLQPQSSTSLTDDLWHHVAGVYDGQQATLYVDGKFVRSFPQGAATVVMNNDSDLVFGAWSSGANGTNTQSRYYNGLLADVGVSSVPLDSSSVRLAMEFSGVGCTAIGAIVSAPQTPTPTTRQSSESAFWPTFASVLTAIAALLTALVGVVKVARTGRPEDRDSPV